MHRVLRSLKRNILFEEVIPNLISTQNLTTDQINKKQFQRQEFLFGKVFLALHLQNSCKIQDYMRMVDQLDPSGRDIVLAILTQEQDLNLRSLFEKCISYNFNMSLKVVFDKFMETYGPLKYREDQEAVIKVQELVNGLAPQLLQN